MDRCVGVNLLSPFSLRVLFKRSNIILELEGQVPPCRGGLAQNWLICIVSILRIVWSPITDPHAQSHLPFKHCSSVNIIYGQSASIREDLWILEGSLTLTDTTTMPQNYDFSYVTHVLMTQCRQTWRHCLGFSWMRRNLSQTNQHHLETTGVFELCAGIIMS